MEEVLKEIGNYGFQVEKMELDGTVSYACANHDTGVAFILDASAENGRRMSELTAGYEACFQPCPPVVFLISAHGREAEIADWIEAGALSGQRILIWDENDEFEFFQKDLWSMLFSLGTGK